MLLVVNIVSKRYPESRVKPIFIVDIISLFNEIFVEEFSFLFYAMINVV